MYILISKFNLIYFKNKIQDTNIHSFYEKIKSKNVYNLSPLSSKLDSWTS